jgi:hypothetical protein
VEDKGMHLQRLWWSGLVAAVLGGLAGIAGVDELLKTGLELPVFDQEKNLAENRKTTWASVR